MSVSFAALHAVRKKTHSGAAPAKNIIDSAQSQIKQKYGMTAYIRPRMWYLSLLKLSLSRPFLIILFALIVGIVLGTWFFGFISLYYGLFFIKSVVAIIANTILTVGNAVYFALHAFTEILLTAFYDIINNIFEIFLTPIINGVNRLAVWTTLVDQGENFLEITALGQGTMIEPQPTHGFAYLVPGALTGPAFITVHPGAEIYEIDASGDILYDVDYEQTGAALLFPVVDEDAKSDGWWTSIKDRPPDKEYTFTYSLQTYTETFYDTIRGWVTGWIDSALDAFSDSIDNTFDQPVNPGMPPIIVPFLPNLVSGIMGLFG